MDGWDQPEEKRADEQDYCQYGLLQHANNVDGKRMLEHTMQGCRHPPPERRPGPGQRDQHRSKMMHGDVLQTIEEELMFGEIFEPGLEHDVEREHAGKKGNPPRESGPLLREH